MKVLKRAALAAVLTLSATQAFAQVKIGALYPFSGGLALLGDESFRGLELAIEERNAAGGLKGQKLEIVKGDAVEPNQAVGEARRLTSVDKVPVIFGTYSSSLSIAATQVAELAGVPYFELGAISDPITERGFKNVYRTNPTARDFAARMVDAVGEAIAPALGVDAKSLKVAIIHEDSLYGQTVAGYQTARAKEKGVTVVETLPYSAKSVDLTPVILRLKTAGADVVLQTSYQNDTVLFFRQMKEQGFKPKAMIGAGGATRCATPCWRSAPRTWKARSTSTSPSSGPIRRLLPGSMRSSRSTRPNMVRHRDRGIRWPTTWARWSSSTRCRRRPT